LTCDPKTIPGNVEIHHAHFPYLFLSRFRNLGCRWLHWVP
jgi:hypothetical protein